MQKWLFLAVAVVCLQSGLFAQTNSCPRGTEDMLTYFLMSYPNRTDHFMGPGNANPIYSSVTPELNQGYATQGYLVWAKGQNGYPWDVKTFDRNFIYDRSTELVWMDPLTFKRFDRDLVLSPRCISTSGGSVFPTPSSRSSYSFYQNCTKYQTSNLGYVVTSISAPTTVNTGGNLGKVKTRYLAYSYSCNSKYSACGAMEVFSLGLNVGLYDWKYYTSKNGKWVMNQESIINNFSVGSTVPLFGCPNTYQ